MIGLTLVSVAFEAEFPLLHLQARSVAAYVPAGRVDEIIVIDNSARGIQVEELDRLRNDYGPLAGKLTVLRPADICQVTGATGWRSQQVLKLCVADQIRTDRYLVLDAKNHFVATLNQAFVAAPDGRSRANEYSYETHPLRPDLHHVLKYLGIDPANHVSRFTATVTPFVMDTALVRELTADIAAKSGRSFAQEFVANDLTEFFLYSGWILSRGEALTDIFDFHQVFCPVVWPQAANLVGIQKAVAAAEERGTPLFAVHRLALARLETAARGALAEFWTDRALFSNTAEASRFILDFQASFRLEKRRQALRDFPHRARSIPRKLISRAHRRLNHRQ